MCTSLGSSMDVDNDLGARTLDVHFVLRHGIALGVTRFIFNIPDEASLMNLG